MCGICEYSAQIPGPLWQPAFLACGWWAGGFDCQRASTRDWGNARAHLSTCLVSAPVPALQPLYLPQQSISHTRRSAWTLPCPWLNTPPLFHCRRAASSFLESILHMGPHADWITSFLLLLPPIVLVKSNLSVSLLLKFTDISLKNCRAAAKMSGTSKRQ